MTGGSFVRMWRRSGGVVLGALLWAGPATLSAAPWGISADPSVAAFAQDSRGNRASANVTTLTHPNREGFGQTFEHDELDRLTSDGVQSYTYDGAGNMLTAGTQTYTYTPFQLVETATVGGALTKYWYDGDNQRRLRERPGGTLEYFVPGPGLVPLAEYRKAPGGSRVLVREYIYAGDRLIASVGLEPAPLPGVAWTDDPLVADVTPVKAVHLTELRDAVNAARATHGLGAVSWTNATVAPGVLVIQPVHLTELRTAINAVYTAAGLTPPTYTDSAAGGAEVRAVHLNEVRAARINAPGPEAIATRFYHLDALGSVRAVTDHAGAEVRRHDYAAFGEEPTPAPGADSRRFTGKERDAETGLDYFSARYYHQGSGRFTTVDPGHVGGDIFDPQSWNAYAYARNNPLRFLDPTGTEYEFCAQGAGCSTVSDRAFDGIFANPGQGYQFSGNQTQGSVWALVDGTWKYAGSYRQLSVDPSPFAVLGAIEEAGRRAEAGIKAGLVEMGASAVLGAWRGLKFAGQAIHAAWAGRSLANGMRPLSSKVLRQMSARGWSEALITEAVRTGKALPAINKANGNPAVRFVHPRTGQSVVVDKVTKEVIHVGGPGFRYWFV